MSVLIDDVGSFPLPPEVDRKDFDRAYCIARKAIVSNKKIENGEFLRKNFCDVTVGSFRKKMETGLDVVTYPQHYDMHRQLADPLRESMDKGTYHIDEKHAILPEVYVIGTESQRLHEEVGNTVHLRVCIEGPLELYLKEIGTVGYEDVLFTFAENARRFAENSILDSKHVKTVTVSLDEPSFGFLEPLTDRETILKTFEKAFDFSRATKQIHLHSSSRISDLLNVENIDVLSFEYAASPENIEGISKRMLDKADKQIRVGISRTDINSITAELYDKGITKPKASDIVESEEAIRKRFTIAKKKYEERMTLTGPDCGLGGWPSQDSAQLLLRRTVRAVRKIGSCQT